MRTVSRAQTRRGKSAIEVGQPGGGQGHDIFDADTVDVDCSQCYGVIVQYRQTYFRRASPVSDRARLNNRRDAGLSFCADQTMLNGSTSSASSR